MSALDRVALAAELHGLSTAMLDESKRWADPEAKLACVEAAAKLHRMGRATEDLLLAVDMDRARALADAASAILGHLEGTRRFIRAARAVDDCLTRAEGRRAG